MDRERGRRTNAARPHPQTAGGRRHPADVLILATGFATQTLATTFDIVGRQGRQLAHAWRDGAYAYRGITVNGFPNLFLLYGPNTDLGHNSILYMLESQFRYVLGAAGLLKASPRACAEVKPAAEAAWNRDLQASLSRSVWATGGCRSWYQGPIGNVTNNWSGLTPTYRRLTRRFDPENYLQWDATPGGIHG